MSISALYNLPRMHQNALFSLILSLFIYHHSIIHVKHVDRIGWTLKNKNEDILSLLNTDFSVV